MERQVTKAILAAVTFVSAALLFAPACAEDYGPHPDIRAIRHDLPIIHKRDGLAKIDGIVVKGNDAVAQWEGENTSWVDVLYRRYDRWWLNVQDNLVWGACPDAHGRRSPIWKLAAEHLPATQTPSPPPPSALGYVAPKEHCDSGAPLPTWESPSVWYGSGYEMVLHPAANDAARLATFTTRLRAPTEAESWVTRGGNSYFFFSATVQSTQPIHVQAGTRIDVWFPFVLKPDKKYSLTIGYTDAPVGPVEGTLKDNTLHFVLPAFSVKPGAHLMGEIEGNPDGP